MVTMAEPALAQALPSQTPSPATTRGGTRGRGCGSTAAPPPLLIDSLTFVGMIRIHVSGHVPLILLPGAIHIPTGASNCFLIHIRKLPMKVDSANRWVPRGKPTTRKSWKLFSRKMVMRKSGGGMFRTHLDLLNRSSIAFICKLHFHQAGNAVWIHS